MIVKRSGSTVFGAHLNSRERKALEIEVKRQIKEFDRRNQLNIEASILWALHEVMGFGPKRLKEFYFGFARYYDELLAYYDMEDDDSYLVMRALKQYGIDIEQWHKEAVT